MTTEKIIDYKELQLTKYIGRGDSGVLYEGVWRDQPVAIKFLGRGDSWAPRMQPSDSLLILKSHPNIAGIIGFSFREDREQHILITEKVKGAKNLNHFIAEHVKCKSFFYPPQMAVNLMYEIAHGLMFLHSSGVIHTSLKPSNILIDENGRAKLVDFGLGNSYWDPNSEAGGAESKKYMAPEVLNSSESYPYTKASDVYSFAAVCFELLTGKLVQDQPLRYDFQCLSRLSCYPGDLPTLLFTSCKTDPRERPAFPIIASTLSEMNRMKTSEEVRRDLRCVQQDIKRGSSKNLLMLHHMLEEVNDYLALEGTFQVEHSIIVEVGAAVNFAQWYVRKSMVPLKVDVELVHVQLDEVLKMLQLCVGRGTYRWGGCAYSLTDKGHPNIPRKLKVDVIGILSRIGMLREMKPLMELVESQILFTHEKTWILLQLASGMRFLHDQNIHGHLDPDVLFLVVPTMSLQIRYWLAKDYFPQPKTAARDVLTYSLICYQLLSGTRPVLDLRGELIESSVVKLPECCSGHSELAQLIHRCLKDSARTSFKMIHEAMSTIRICLALNCRREDLEKLK